MIGFFYKPIGHRCLGSNLPCTLLYSTVQSLLYKQCKKKIGFGICFDLIPSISPFTEVSLHSSGGLNGRPSSSLQTLLQSYRKPRLGRSLSSYLNHANRLGSTWLGGLFLLIVLLVNCLNHVFVQKSSMRM